MSVDLGLDGQTATDLHCSDHAIKDAHSAGRVRAVTSAGESSYDDASIGLPDLEAMPKLRRFDRPTQPIKKFGRA